MSEYTSYYLYQKYQRRGTGEWTPVSPSVYSIDGEGTMPLSIKNENDPNCGYAPEPIYEWVNIDISTDFVCDECICSGGVITRWLQNSDTTDYTCSGTSKYYKQYEQTSSDCGATWQNTGNWRIGNLIVNNSIDCGYAPPPAPSFGTKFSATYLDSSVCNVDCNGSPKLKSNEKSGYQNSAMTSYTIGECVTSLGDNFFEGTINLTTLEIPDNVIYVGRDVAINSGANSIIIGSNVSFIGDAAFMYCNNLTGITVNAITPPLLEFTYESGHYTTEGTRQFESTNSCPIFVPVQSVCAYQSDPRWSRYADRIQPITN